MTPFTALRIHETDQGIAARFEQLELAALSAGDVLIRVSHSSINYKDALAATGAGRILRRYPLIGGIDLAGVVCESHDARFPPGTAVLVSGCGLSETRDGGYAQYARVPADALVAIPQGLDAQSSMILGTAGYAAALAVIRLLHNGLEPQHGPVAVTGASGGVGALAIDMLAGLGFTVCAVSGKAEAADWLRSLGAQEVLTPAALGNGAAPLASARWAGAIDNLGGAPLAALLASLKISGSCASVGMAAGSALHTTVMPFILRGAALLGVNSSNTTASMRERVWQRMATDLKPRHLQSIHTRTVALADLPTVFPEYLAGQVRGRTVVSIP